MKKRKIKYVEKDLPLYCDFSCKYADFTEPSCVGAWRRDIGVWCKILNTYNNKHARCLVKKSKE